MKKKHCLMVGVAIAGLALLGLGCDSSGGGSGCGSSTPVPYISAAGIGVSDLQRSIDFYTTVLELDYAGKQSGKMSRIVEEAILKDRDGQNIYLMDFGPDEDYTRRPGKLVFAVPDADTYYERVLANGGTSVSAPTSVLGTMVALTRDPDGYIVELMGISTSRRPVLVAVGIGASDLRASRAFFEDVIGLEYSSGMNVPGLMDEQILESPRDMGVDLVIMDYDAAMDYTNVPAKIVLSVDDTVAFADAIAADDPRNILVQPTATQVGYAKDIEGTLMEIVQE